MIEVVIESKLQGITQTLPRKVESEAGRPFLTGQKLVLNPPPPAPALTCYHDSKVKAGSERK